MDNSLVEKVRRLFLKYEMGEFDSLRIQHKKELAQIESYFTLCDDVYNRIREELKQEIDLSIRGICRGSDVAKSTVYKEDNKPILKEYIDRRLADCDLEDRIEANCVLINKLDQEKLEASYKAVKRDLDVTIVDKIILTETQQKNLELSLSVSTLSEKLKALQIERALLLKELSELRGKLIKQSCQVNTDYQ